MEKRLSNIFKIENVKNLTNAILKSSYRILQESICLISCIIFEEKYFSSYILSTDQISLSGCLYFVRYWAICVILTSFHQYFLKRMLLVSYKVVFIEIEAVTMHNYVGTCKSIFSYNLVCNFFIQLFSLQSSVFLVHFSNAFCMGTRHFLKIAFRIKLLLSLLFFIYHIANIGV